MSNKDTPSRPASLLAIKGQAMPAPAVGYVSVRNLQGKPERRQNEERRTGSPGNDRRFKVPDIASLFRQKAAAPVPESPSGGWGVQAPGVEPEQEPVTSPEPTAEAPAEEAPAPWPAPEIAAGGLASSLASLIHRKSPPTPREAPADAPQSPKPKAAAEPPAAATPKAPPKIKPAKRVRRRKMTLRLTQEEFEHIEELAKRDGTSWQNVMEAAVVAFYSK